MELPEGADVCGPAHPPTHAHMISDERSHFQRSGRNATHQAAPMDAQSRAAPAARPSRIVLARSVLAPALEQPQTERAQSTDAGQQRGGRFRCRHRAGGLRGWSGNRDRNRDRGRRCGCGCGWRCSCSRRCGCGVLRIRTQPDHPPAAARYVQGRGWRANSWTKSVRLTVSWSWCPDRWRAGPGPGRDRGRGGRDRLAAALASPVPPAIWRLGCLKLQVDSAGFRWRCTHTRLLGSSTTGTAAPLKKLLPPAVVACAVVPLMLST